MTTEFDPLRAAREELTGLVDLRRSWSTQVHRVAEEMARIEAELNDLRKLDGFLLDLIARQKARVRELETATV